MIQTILDRTSGRVLYVAEIEADDDSPERVRLGLALKAALKAGADLGRADLGGADLGRADLGRAYLGGADLGRADLGRAYLGGAIWGDGAKRREGVPITRSPVTVVTDLYTIWIWDRHVEIGCKIHEIEAWAAFVEADIKRMDGERGVLFWRAWRDPLLAIAKAAGRPLPAPAEREAV